MREFPYLVYQGSRMLAGFRYQTDAQIWADSVPVDVADGGARVVLNLNYQE